MNRRDVLSPRVARSALSVALGAALFVAGGAQVAYDGSFVGLDLSTAHAERGGNGGGNSGGRSGAGGGNSGGRSDAGGGNSGGRSDAGGGNSGGRSGAGGGNSGGRAKSADRGTAGRDARGRDRASRVGIHPSELGSLNAVNASATARANASPNSTVAAIAAFEGAIAADDIEAAAEALASKANKTVSPDVVAALGARLGVEIDAETAEAVADEVAALQLDDDVDTDHDDDVPGDDQDHDDVDVDIERDSDV